MSTLVEEPCATNDKAGPFSHGSDTSSSEDSLLHLYTATKDSAKQERLLAHMKVSNGNGDRPSNEFLVTSTAARGSWLPVREPSSRIPRPMKVAPLWKSEPSLFIENRADVGGIDNEEDALEHLLTSQSDTGESCSTTSYLIESYRDRTSTKPKTGCNGEGDVEACNSLISNARKRLIRAQLELENSQATRLTCSPSNNQLQENTDSDLENRISSYTEARHSSGSDHSESEAQHKSREGCSPEWHEDYQNNFLGMSSGVRPSDSQRSLYYLPEDMPPRSIHDTSSNVPSSSYRTIAQPSTSPIFDYARLSHQTNAFFDSTPLHHMPMMRMNSSEQLRAEHNQWRGMRPSHGRYCTNTLNGPKMSVYDARRAPARRDLSVHTLSTSSRSTTASSRGHRYIPYYTPGSMSMQREQNRDRMIESQLTYRALNRKYTPPNEALPSIKHRQYPHYGGHSSRISPGTPLSNPPAEELEGIGPTRAENSPTLISHPKRSILNTADNSRLGSFSRAKTKMPTPVLVSAASENVDMKQTGLQELDDPAMNKRDQGPRGYTHHTHHRKMRSHLIVENQKKHRPSNYDYVAKPYMTGDENNGLAELLYPSSTEAKKHGVIVRPKKKRPTPTHILASGGEKDHSGACSQKSRKETPASDQLMHQVGFDIPHAHSNNVDKSEEAKVLEEPPNIVTNEVSTRAYPDILPPRDTSLRAHFENDILSTRTASTSSGLPRVDSATLSGLNPKLAAAVLEETARPDEELKKEEPTKLNNEPSVDMVRSVSKTVMPKLSEPGVTDSEDLQAPEFEEYRTLLTYLQNASPHLTEDIATDDIVKPSSMKNTRHRIGSNKNQPATTNPLNHWENFAEEARPKVQNNGQPKFKMRGSYIKGLQDINFDNEDPSLAHGLVNPSRIISLTGITKAPPKLKLRNLQQRLLSRSAKPTTLSHPTKNSSISSTRSIRSFFSRSKRSLIDLSGTPESGNEVSGTVRSHDVNCMSELLEEPYTSDSINKSTTQTYGSVVRHTRALSMDDAKDRNAPVLSESPFRHSLGSEDLQKPDRRSLISRSKFRIGKTRVGRNLKKYWHRGGGAIRRLIRI